MKKYLLSFFVAISTVFLFSCKLTELVTDIIAKEEKTNEIQYKINYTNKDEDNSVYQFRFEDIPLEYCKNITFDFNSFYGTEGKVFTDGEMGFFFNLTKNNIDEELQDWDPDLSDDKKTCNFYLLTISKYKYYEINYLTETGTVAEGTPEQEPPVIYEINIYNYQNINFNNLINKNIIGDKNGYDINTIYCDVSCTCTWVDSKKIEEKDFQKISVSEYKFLNINKTIYFDLKDPLYGTDLKINGLYGIYSRINKDKTFKAEWHFNAKEKQ